MNPLSLSGARVIDPILTNVARGYKNMALVFMALFPIVNVAQRGGKILEFSADAFGQYSIERAPGADIAEVEFGYVGKDYNLLQRAISGKVSMEHMEEARAVPAIDLGREAVLTAREIIDLSIERAAATLATTSANYSATHTFALAGSSQWSHDDSTPAKYIEAKKELIAQGVGREPNVMVVGIEVGRALRNNPDVIDRIKHTQGLTGSAGPIVSDAALAQYFGVDMFVEAKSRSGEVGNLKPIWGKHVVLAYSAVGSLASRGTPSFGYTYRLNNYPLVEAPHWDNGKRSWMYPVITEDTPVIAGKDAGVLLRNVVA